jgi:hypothetical protein
LLSEPQPSGEPTEPRSDLRIDDQVRRCREFVERAGGTVQPSRVFTDYATSGASLARSGFEAMMEPTKGNKPAVDVIVAGYEPPETAGITCNSARSLSGVDKPPVNLIASPSTNTFT